MTLKTFTTLIEGLQSYRDKKDKLYTLGIDILSFDEDYYREVTRPLMVEAFTEEGMQWIYWYLYERESISGEPLKAFDKEGNEICFDIPSLYDTIKEYLK